MSRLVEGRWTIYVCTGCGSATGRHDKCDAKREATEVVPCDEPAIERLAQHLYDTDENRIRTEGPDGEVTSDWHREPDGYRGLYRDRARNALNVVAAEAYS